MRMCLQKKTAKFRPGGRNGYSMSFIDFEQFLEPIGGECFMKTLFYLASKGKTVGP